MRTQQEIINMENFYATATLEEAIAYFKFKSTKCFNSIKTACNKALKIIGGIMARFSKKKSTAYILKYDLSVDKVLQNCMNVSKHDQLQMNMLLIDALEILIKE